MSAELLRLVPLGTRVVVRFLIEEGERATDVVGPLLERDDDLDTVTVDSRRGPVVVELAQVVLAKPVPPAPAPRPRRPQLT